MTSHDPAVEAAQLINAAYRDVERGDFGAAKLKLENSLWLNDESADGHSEYALVLLKLGQHSSAGVHIRRSIELAPRNPKFWLALAKWHFDVGELDSASRCVLVGEQIDPRYQSVPIAKAHILKAKGGSASEVAELLNQARKIYNEVKKRADGTPLAMGDVERFLTMWEPERNVGSTASPDRKPFLKRLFGG